ncbi:NEL-type E3 ubiquitin ligase domain-containing protein [Pseudomonas sp. Bout1]|uniref:NEL-type E3 ubiquitin ligase domain-containing protein n=1 Tax=Pseudomonas sp. Bout1 TaxID=3048600 RepID=UPI002AB429A4|nr:NEL-type E3 ubiquitin ligase domain-containing protein [Pseudomonas sp. Bout1]MDY7530627.1 NEL-type E3 ubiquitin ligase domain-containing protein [Pseudomonas sp. Bout1]MEB0185509.1 NEL-type E3 ubiquitin ligase domain-containing protein [Pseudomonas sp. Bout1]
MFDVPTTTAGTLIEDNSDFIQQAIPEWLKQATRQRIDGIKQVNLKKHTWLDRLPADQRHTLNALNEASFSAQLAVDNYLAPLEKLDVFAARLLNAELKKQFNISLDIGGTYLRLYKPLKLGSVGIKAGTFTVMEVSIVQAALHNFEASEAEPEAFDSTSGFTQNLDVSGCAPAISRTLTVPVFIALCRSMDIGGAYQKHLNQILLPAEEGTATRFREAVITSQKAALKAAAYMALLKNDILADDHAMILEVIDGERNPMLGGKPVWFFNLSMVNRSLHGCQVFQPCEKYRYGVDSLVYVPHDRDHPLKRYNSNDELRAELTRQLLAQDTDHASAVEGDTPAPSVNQRFFSQFFAEADKPRFLSRFTELAPGTHPIGDAIVRSPITNNLLGAVLPALGAVAIPQELPPPKPDKRVRADNPKLNISVVSKGGLWAANVDLWADGFEKSRDKMLNDARHRATPTADVDARVRAEKIAQWLEGGLAVFGMVSMFVPVLGELMMAAMAGQLLYETFEGVIEWSDGDKEAARQHLLDVAENLALMALMAGAGKGLQRLATPPLIQELKPVTLPNGTQRLWEPDLTVYGSETTLPDNAPLDELGLHTDDQTSLLPLNGQVFTVKPEADGQSYRIQHPWRQDAYTPHVEHDGAGAWIHEGEEPLTWQGPPLMRRLGYRTEGLTDAQLEQVRVSSGVTPEQLRQLHVNHEPPPPVLVDSLERFQISQRIDTFIQRIASENDYVRADIQLAKRVVAHKNLNFELVYGTTVKPMAEQAAQWRQQIARAAVDSRTTLFDDDYRAHDATQDPQVQRIKDQTPGLPSTSARQVLENATDEEASALREHDSLSPRLKALARDYRQETRLSRAYEGLFIDALQNPDSQRLALHTLETLPGWEPGLRVELRLGSEQGPLLDAIGTPGPTPPVVLAAGEEGTFGATDLYGAVLQRLSHVQRRALGDAALDNGTLKQRVRQTPLTRERLRPVLLQYPAFNKPLAPGAVLRGGAPLLGLNRLRTTDARVRRLYPGFNEEQVNTFIASHGERVRDELLHLESQYATLKQELKDWVLQGEQDERARNPLERNPGFRERDTAKKLKSCWRRQLADRADEHTGRLLKIHSGVKLPKLSADFAHVEELLLYAVSFTESPQAFLGRFPNLKRLTLQHIGGAAQRTLTELPEVVTTMKELTHLDVAENAIVLDQSSASSLAGLTKLEELTLSNNPLGHLPDFSAMPGLRKLKLKMTQIHQWPTGLLGLQKLRLVDLSSNLLSEVPEALLNPTPEAELATLRLNRVTRLHHNPFTLQACQDMRASLDRLAQTRPDWREGGLPGGFEVPLSADPQVARLRELFPMYSEAQKERFIIEAGARADAELTRLEAEWQTLEATLEHWVSERFMVEAGPDHIRAGSPDHRWRFAMKLRECWKRMTRELNAHDGTPIGHSLEVQNLQVGELPVLDADFSHVGQLKLNAMTSLYGVDGFLGRFSKLRWLELTHSNLSSIPPNLARMQRLTRLNLSGNRITMTEADAAIIEELSSLKEINLSYNPLARTPDFSAMTDLRGLYLNNTGITQWPTGLGAQLTPEHINLSDNQIASLPQAQVNPTPEQAPMAIRINNVTYIGGNPLTEETQLQLGEYRLNVAPNYAEAAERRPNTMLYRAPGAQPAAAAQPLYVPAPAAPEPAFKHWMRDRLPQEVAEGQQQWELIAAKPGSEAFLGILKNLKDSEEYSVAYPALQARVWEMIEAAQDPGLCEDLFATAGDPRCGDRAALVFSDMEVKVLIWRATRWASDTEKGPALLELAKGLFRLDEVEKIATREIQMRERTIRGSRLSEQQKIDAIRQVEDIEIRLAYRMGLQKRLKLPGQPTAARYLATAQLPTAVLGGAAVTVERLDNTAQALQSLLGREFWQAFVRNHYPEAFEALNQPFELRLQMLDDSQAAGTLSAADYDAQAQDLQLQRAIEEAQLIKQLTVQDWFTCRKGCVIA